MRVRVLTSMASASLLLAACGSTVQLHSTRALEGAGVAAGDAPGVVAGSDRVAEQGAPPSAGGPGRGRQTGRTSGRLSQGPSQGADAPAPGRLPSTVSASGRVVVGYLTQKDVGSAGAAIGLAGIATGDPDNQMRAIADAINARGGFLGHRIALVSHDVSTAQATSNPAEAAGVACADLVEKKATIVVNPGANPELLSCFKKHGIIVVGSTSISSASEVFAPSLPGVYAPSAMSIDRYLPAVVDRLHAQGYFAKWDTRAGSTGIAPVKIGVQAFDTAAGRHYVAVLQRALQRYGLRVDETDLHSTDVSQNSAATSAAVLRFSARGVTHVFNANVLFYRDADSQGYKPRYAVDDTVATPALLAQNVGKSQLHGAMGAGYLPAYEVPRPQDVSPAATRCKQLMTRAGEDVHQPLTLAYVLQACDAMNFLERGFAAGGAVSAVGLRNGLSRMGPFQSSITYRSTPSPSHYDGASGIRDFTYRDDCGCFAFPSSRIFPVP